MSAATMNGKQKPARPKAAAVEVPTIDLPHSSEMEYGLCAAIIANPKAILDDDVSSTNVSDFFEPIYRELFAVGAKMVLAGEPAYERSALAKRLQAAPSTTTGNVTNSDSLFDDLGGSDFLHKLFREATVFGGNARFYAGEVQKLARQRTKLSALNGALHRIHLGDDIEQAAATAVEHIQRVSKPETSAPLMFPIVDADELFTTKYEVRWLVPGMITWGQPGLIAGPKKALKTSVAEDLSVSLAAGYPFLGNERWKPERRRVLFCSAESGDATIAETAKRIADSKGIDHAELKGWLRHCWSVPLLDNVQHLEEFRRTIRASQAEVIICDPAYLMFSGDADAANLFSMGARLRALNELCSEFGATVLLVHHFKKGRTESATPQLEDIAYAGFQEHCRQWLMLDREDEYKPGSGEHKLIMSWGGSAGQSGEVSLTVSEGINDGSSGERFWVTEVLDRKAREERKAETKSKAEQERIDHARRKIDTAFVSAAGKPLTPRELADRCGCDPRAKPHLAALGAMIREGKVESTEITKANKQTYEAYLRKWGKDEQPEAPSESAA